MLNGHPAVAQVLYPGLPEHPGHDVARRQMRDFGGMVSFLAASGEDAALDIVARTRLFTLAESLGAVESLIEHPARMTHSSAAGSPLAVDPALVRLSVGIEAVDDLVADSPRGTRRRRLAPRPKPARSITLTRRMTVAQARSDIRHRRWSSWRRSRSPRSPRVPARRARPRNRTHLGAQSSAA
jgi:hypothetical protein